MLNPNNSLPSSSGSATGTTRNKVALKPGFSLVGWIRLTNSEDLTGTNGRRFAVTLDELNKHNKKEDCWTAIRGKVFNITRYLEYHPGGVGEILRCAGCDGTKLFDEVHPWVNLEQLLAKCYIGPLKSSIILDYNPFESTKKLNLAPCKEENEDKEVEVNIPTKVIPRFDWIQKTNELTIYFYTKNYCNAGITLNRIEDKIYEVVIYIGSYSHTYKFNFLNPLKFPPKTFNVNQESGKIEIIFEKSQEELWGNLGVFEKIKTLKSDDENYPTWTECNIIKSNFINHDSFELTLRPKNNQIFMLPIGYHLSFKLNGVVRSFTPVPSNFLINGDCTNDLNFLIKKYEQGTMSKHLADLIGDKGNEILSISQQKGSLDLNRLKDHRKFLLLAAGSGITPFLQLLPHFLGRKNIESIKLLYFNKTSRDIWCREKLDQLTITDDRFKVNYILAVRINRDMLKEEDATFALVCGNTGFNQQSLKILDELKKEIHCFDG